MEIPYYVLGLIYCVILLGYGVALFFNLYHMVRFGMFDFTGRLNTVLLLGAISIIITFTVILLEGVDWTETFSITDFTVPSLSIGV